MEKKNFQFFFNILLIVLIFDYNYVQCVSDDYDDENYDIDDDYNSTDYESEPDFELPLLLDNDNDNDDNFYNISSANITGSKYKRSSLETNISLVQSIDKFSLKMFSILAKQYPGQVIQFSPLSLHMCISLSILGTPKPIRSQFLEQLGVQLKEQIVPYAYDALIEELTEREIFYIKNKIFIKKGIKGRRSFFENVMTYFPGKGVQFDFVAGAGGIPVINDYVTRYSKHLLPNFIMYDALFSVTDMILLNVMYFKAQWDFHLGGHVKNDCNETEIENGIIPSSTEAEPIEGNFLYNRFSKGKMLMLPFQMSNIKRLTVKPKAEHLSNIESQLGKKTIKDIVQTLRKTTTTWNESSKYTDTTIDLSEALKKFGLNQLFTSKAEFSRISKSTKRFKMARIIHKTSHQLNENGVQVAAATAIILHSKCSRPLNITHEPICRIPDVFAYVKELQDGNFLPLLIGRDV